VPGHHLVNTEDYLAVLRDVPNKFPAGDHFSYCNSGYVVLALIAERLSECSFHRLVTEQVLKPAGMTRTGFFRFDDLPGDAALGYLDDGRTNIFMAPVRGSGDGGAFTTVGDVQKFWAALMAGKIVPQHRVRQMISPQSAGPPAHRMHYGWGVWLDGDAVVLDGGDHGVSFRSTLNPASRRLWTAVSNASRGIDPLIPRLRHLLF